MKEVYTNKELIEAIRNAEKNTCIFFNESSDINFVEAKKVFEKYGNENYKDILSKVIGANELLDSKKPNITEEEKQGAKDILQEYGKITMPLQSFENLRMEALSKPMAKEALKKDLTEMFKPKKGESS